MPSKWDEEEERTDREQSYFYADLQRPVKPAVQTGTESTRDMSYPPAWQRWGLPAGLTLGILIGLIVGYVITFVYLLD